MSRSYKKTPWSGDRKGKIKKRIANQTVRSWLKQHPDIKLSKGDFKKIYETWDICDYGYKMTWEEYWESEIRHYYWFKMNFPEMKTSKYCKYPDKKESYKQWYKWYKMK